MRRGAWWVLPAVNALFCLSTLWGAKVAREAYEAAQLSGFGLGSVLPHGVIGPALGAVLGWRVGERNALLVALVATFAGVAGFGHLPAPLSVTWVSVASGAVVLLTVALVARSSDDGPRLVMAFLVLHASTNVAHVLSGFEWIRSIPGTSSLALASLAGATALLFWFTGAEPHRVRDAPAPRFDWPSLAPAVIAGALFGLYGPVTQLGGAHAYELIGASAEFVTSLNPPVVIAGCIVFGLAARRSSYLRVPSLVAAGLLLCAAAVVVLLAGTGRTAAVGFVSMTAAGEVFVLPLLTACAAAAQPGRLRLVTLVAFTAADALYGVWVDALAAQNGLVPILKMGAVLLTGAAVALAILEMFRSSWLWPARPAAADVALASAAEVVPAPPFSGGR